jgi:hypothetical protein
MISPRIWRKQLSSVEIYAVLSRRDVQFPRYDISFAIVSVNNARYAQQNPKYSVSVE